MVETSRDQSHLYPCVVCYRSSCHYHLVSERGEADQIACGFNNRYTFSTLISVYSTLPSLSFSPYDAVPDHPETLV